jgi:hypothetical protein
VNSASAQKLRKRVRTLEEQVVRWKSVNNDLYQFMVNNVALADHPQLLEMQVTATEGEDGKKGKGKGKGKRKGKGKGKQNAQTKQTTSGSTEEAAQEKSS